MKICKLISLGFKYGGRFTKKNGVCSFLPYGDSGNDIGIIYAITEDCEVLYIGKFEKSLRQIMSNYAKGNYDCESTWNRIHRGIVKAKDIEIYYIKYDSEDADSLRKRFRQNEVLKWDK